MKKLMLLSLAAIMAVSAGCGAWRPCASVTPPMAPSYCAPVPSFGYYSPCAVKSPPPAKYCK